MSVEEQEVATGLEGAVWTALGTVRDPELDEPITNLDFVASLRVQQGQVFVALRLPTYFCAPNFAYLMVADARDAVAAVTGVTSVEVRLEDHFAADQINAGVGSDTGFSGAFPDQAQEELDDLRRIFQRKAHTACLERACRRLVDAGWEIEALPDARLADLPPVRERDSLLRRRAELGLSIDPQQTLLVTDQGDPVPVDDMAVHLRFARAVRVSIEGNAGLCRGLLKTRYGEGDDPGTRSSVAAERRKR